MTFQFETATGTLIDENTYGNDYGSEYERILIKYAGRADLRYLEWGAGITTKITVSHCQKLGCSGAVSIDHVLPYVKSLASSIEPNDFLKIFWADEIGSYGSAGANYSTLPLSFGTLFDFILIDGRRRLECALVATKVAGPNAIVVLHDFARERYKLFDALFEVLEVGPQFKICRPKRQIAHAMTSVSLESLGFNSLNDPEMQTVRQVFPLLAND